MATNYRQIYAINTKNKALIKQQCPTMQDKAGIYVFYRIDENGDKFAYLGQAVGLLTRCSSHLVGYKKKNPTHIDLSLFKRKLYSETNPYGWKVAVACYCDKSQLDAYEQAYIKTYQDKKITLLNVTGGGQFNKEQDINERYQPNLKRYKSGKNKGYEQCLTEVRTYFDKYLDFAIKPPTNKIKERKAEEFKKFLEGEQ